jgi:hypothetical protein
MWGVGNWAKRLLIYWVAIFVGCTRRRDLGGGGETGMRGEGKGGKSPRGFNISMDFSSRLYPQRKWRISQVENWPAAAIWISRTHDDQYWPTAIWISRTHDDRYWPTAIWISRTHDDQYLPTAIWISRTHDDRYWPTAIWISRTHDDQYWPTAIWISLAQ